jgi:hypothetical protein
MKKRNLLIYAAFIWVASCTPKADETSEQPIVLEKDIEPNDQFSFSPETWKAFDSDHFTMKATSEVGYNFLSNSKFQALEPKINFGGTFEAKYFKNENNKSIGVRFWFCYNHKKGDKDYPEFFLALEQVENYDTLQPESFVDVSKKLRVPIISGFNNSLENGALSLEDYFTGYLNTEIINNKEIEFTKVLHFAFAFKNLMIDLDSIFGHLPSKYAVSYFEFNQAYDDFMKLNPDKVKYTMGFFPVGTDDIYHKPNYFRPVLMAIGRNGKIIHNDPAYAKGTFLQRSFPPPPNQ